MGEILGQEITHERLLMMAYFTMTKRKSVSHIEAIFEVEPSWAQKITARFRRRFGISGKLREPIDQDGLGRFLAVYQALRFGQPVEQAAKQSGSLEKLQDDLYWVYTSFGGTLTDYARQPTREDVTREDVVLWLAFQNVKWDIYEFAAARGVHAHELTEAAREVRWREYEEHVAAVLERMRATDLEYVERFS